MEPRDNNAVPSDDPFEPSLLRTVSRVSSSSSDGLLPPTDIGELVQPAESGNPWTESRVPTGEAEFFAGESRIDARLRRVAQGAALVDVSLEDDGFQAAPLAAVAEPGEDTESDELIARMLAQEWAIEDAEARQREAAELAASESLGPSPPDVFPGHSSTASSSTSTPIAKITPTLSTLGTMIAGTRASAAQGRNEPPPPPKPPRQRLIRPEVPEDGHMNTSSPPPPPPPLKGPGASQSAPSLTQPSVSHRKPSPAWLQTQKDRSLSSSNVQSRALPSTRPANRDADLPDPPSPELPSLLAGSAGSASATDSRHPPFLQLLKSPKYSSLLAPLRSFLSNFPNVPWDRRPGEFQNYMARIHGLVAGLDPCKEDPTMVDKVLEGIEKLLLSKSYGNAFAPLPDREMDLKLFQNLVRHSWVVPEMLDVRIDQSRKGYWTVAVDEIGKLDNYRAPRDKLAVLVNAVRIVVLMLDTATETPREPNKIADVGPASPMAPSVATDSPTSPVAALPNADLLLPALIYLIILARPRALPANLHYIQRYRSQPLSGEESYIVTTFLAASEWATKMGPTELHVDAETWKVCCDSSEHEYLEERKRREDEIRAARLERERTAQKTAGGTGEAIADALLKPLQFLGRFLDDSSPTTPRGPSRSNSFNASPVLALGRPELPVRPVSQPISPPLPAPPAPNPAASLAVESPFLRQLSEAERKAYDDFDAQLAWALEQSQLEAGRRPEVEIWENAEGLLNTEGLRASKLEADAPLDLLTGETSNVEDGTRQDLLTGNESSIPALLPPPLATSRASPSLTTIAHDGNGNVRRDEIGET